VIPLVRTRYAVAV